MIVACSGRRLASLVVGIAMFCSVITSPVDAAKRELQLQHVGTYASGVFNRGAAEIVAHDSATQRLFIVNGGSSSIAVVSISNPAEPMLLFTIDMTPFGRQANSVAVRRGVVAVAIEATIKTDFGTVAFFDANGQVLSSVTVGSLPDMLTFTPDGKRVLVANEGEPIDNYDVDPEGSVSIINIKSDPAHITQDDVVNVDFTGFNEASLQPSIRIFGPGASVAQDLEPEYIAVSPNSKTAWVTLQENNALGILDIESGRITDLVGLGFKDHLLAANAFDASDRDAGINITPWPVRGLYQPDAIAAYRSGGQTFLITANEGDSREYAGYAEERRVGALSLDSAAFPSASELLTNAQLGRLTVTAANGDTDGDGDYDELYVLGGRSFSIRSTDGTLIYDSGSDFERITAEAFPSFFNSSNDSNNSFDTRSDNKGPEPEGVVTGRFFGRIYAFIGLERIGGVMVYDVSNPHKPRFVQYVNNRDFAGTAATGTAGDLGPEGLLLISQSDSPVDDPLLVVANEVSGTTTLYRITKQRR